MLFAVTCISISVVGFVISVWVSVGDPPDWLAAMMEDWVALACGTGVIALGLWVLNGRESPIGDTAVAISGPVVFCIVAQLRLRRRRRRDATATDA